MNRYQTAAIKRITKRELGGKYGDYIVNHFCILDLKESCNIPMEDIPQAKECIWRTINESYADAVNGASAERSGYFSV